MKLYTTGEVSRLCQVSPATVNKWFDSGELEGFRIPGSRHRRIPHENLVRFLQRYNAPIGPLETRTESLHAVSPPRDTITSHVDAPPRMAKSSRAKEVLLVSRDAGLIRRLNQSLKPSSGYTLTVAGDGFGIGWQLNGAAFDLAIVDNTIGEAAAEKIVAALRSWHGDAIPLLAIAGPHLASDNGWTSVADETFHRPFDPALLVARIRSRFDE